MKHKLPVSAFWLTLYMWCLDCTEEMKNKTAVWASECVIGAYGDHYRKDNAVQVIQHTLLEEKSSQYLQKKSVCEIKRWF